VRRFRLVLGALLGAVALTLALLAACGSDSPAGGPGSHDSPEGAVRGFLDAVAANDLKDALNWIPPNQRKAASDLLNGALGVKVSFSVQHIDVGSATIDGRNPDQASVGIKGQASACVNGGSGDSALNTCYPFSKFAQAAGADQISCIRIGGQWYVDFGSGSDTPPPDLGSPAPSTVATPPGG
jgi:hypothetical protein